jgi:RNA polymerase-binding transcription factor DksA
MIATIDIESHRQRLLTLLGRLDAQCARLRRDTSHMTDDDPPGARGEPTLEPVDLSVNRQEDEVLFGMLENEDHLHAEVSAALARIADHSFGHCLRCGHAITEARLRAIPYARHCIACAVGRKRVRNSARD